MRQLVEYYQETVGGVRGVLALFPAERQKIDGVWYTRAYGRLWHLSGAGAPEYGERYLSDDALAALHKVKVAHVVDAAPQVVDAGTGYLRERLRRGH